MYFFVVPSTCFNYFYFSWKAPTFPRMTFNNLQRAGLTLPHSALAFYSTCRWRRATVLWSKNVFPVNRVVLFPTCLKAASHQGLLKLLLLVNYLLWIWKMWQCSHLENMQELQPQNFTVTAIHTVCNNDGAADLKDYDMGASITADFVCKHQIYTFSKLPYFKTCVLQKNHLRK